MIFYTLYIRIGITRRTVIELAVTLTIQYYEKRLSLVDFYTADEVFTTGTMGELTPVVAIDGRKIGYTSTYTGTYTDIHEYVHIPTYLY